MDAGSDSGSGGAGGVTDAGCGSTTVGAATIQWSHTFGTAVNDRAADVTTGASDEVFVVGYTSGVLGAVDAPGDGAFLQKLDAAGNVAWTHQFGSAGNDSASSVRLDSDANILVGGITSGDLQGSNQGKFDGFVRKLKNGTSGPEEQWTYQFGTAEDEYVHAIAADSAGNVLITGRTLGDLSGNSAGASDVYVRKLDKLGVESWTVQFGTSGAEQGMAIATDQTGAVYVAGYTEGALGGANAGSWDGFLRKLSATDGSEIWTRQFGGAGVDAAWSLAVDPSGNAYVGGWVSDQQGCQHFGGQDGFVAAYDSDGKLRWTHQFGRSFGDQVLSIALAGQGVVVGGTGDLDGMLSGNTDAFVRELDGSGTPVWSLEVLATSADEYTNGVWADPKGNVYAVGHDQTIGNNEAFIAKLAP